MKTKFTKFNIQTNNEISQIDNSLNLPTNILDTQNDNQNCKTIIRNESQEKENFWIPLPYIGNISNKIGGYLRKKLNWKITYTPEI